MLRSLRCEAQRRRGVAYVLARSANSRHVLTAQFAAESGLEFMLQRMNNAPLPHDTTAESLVANLTDALSDQFTFADGPDLTAQFNGVILGLSDWEMILDGTNSLLFNRDGIDTTPAGFEYWVVLTMVPDSYGEPVGQAQ